MNSTFIWLLIMNLLQMAQLIGQRTGMVQPNDLTATESFLQLRHDQVWRSRLWKDAIIEYVFPINASAPYVANSAYMPTKGHLMLPSIFSNVVAARSDTNALNVERPMIYYRVDWDQFSRTGNPLQYALLAACVWEFDTPQDVFAWGSNVGDNGQILQLDSSADGINAARTAVALSTGGADLGMIDHIDNLTKPATQGQVLIAPAVNTPLPANYPPSAGPPAQIAYNMAKAGTWYRVVPGASDGSVVFQTGNGGTGINLQPGVPVIFQVGIDSVIDIFSVPTVVVLPVTATLQQLGPVVLRLQPEDTAAARCQRLRLFPIPSGSPTLRILGKRTAPPFSLTTDLPGVQGFEPILIALAYYDMLHRDERGGTPEAQNALAEAVGPAWLQGGPAGGWLKRLEDEEVFQGAHNSRILPESGFGFDDQCYGGAIGTKFY